MSYSAYLEEHIQTQLTKAIAEATIQNPKDAVDYIGKYLLKIVEDDAKAKQKKDLDSKWEEEDKALALKKEEKEALIKQKEDQKKMDVTKEEEFYAKLANCKCKTEAMQLWTEYIADKTKSASVYIGEPCQLKQEEEDVDGLLYNAVSSKNNQFLLNTTFIASETKGIVFDLLKTADEAEAEEEENEEDEDAEQKKKEVIKARKNIHIENVLLPHPYKDKLHFFKYPKVGSFLAFESCIKSYLNTEAIQAELRPQWPRPIEEVIAEQKAKEEAEAAEKAEQDANGDGDKEQQEPKEEEVENNEDEVNNEEEEEKEQEFPPDPVQVDKKYVVSMDTLGGEGLYDENMRQWIDENIGKLEEILMKIDVNEYLEQRKFEENLKVKLAEYEEKIQGEIEAKVAEIEKENEANSEEIKSFKTNQHVIEAMEPMLSIIGDHRMKPEQSSFCRIIAAFAKLFDFMRDEQKLTLINHDLSQFDVISNRAWNQCLDCFQDITTEKVNGYNPSELDKFDSALIENILNGINVEEIGSEGFAIIATMLYQFVDAACKLYKYTQNEKEKQESKAEEEPDAAKEKEEEETADAE